jgi:diphosphomevalonate decarboxylase
MKIKFRSPSNIALVKYWGKKANQIPMNPSVSLTLSQSFTEMEIEFFESDELKVEFWFHENRNPKFEEKILKKLNEFSKEFDGLFSWITKTFFKIHSINSFPHSSGIASSASSMSALALAIVEIYKTKLLEKGEVLFDENTSRQMSSHLARIGSGSASRSIYGTAASWGACKELDCTSDLFATEVLSVHPLFQNMKDAILIVSEGEKSVSSSAGHELMNSHPHRESRLEIASTNFKKMLDVLKTGDFENFKRIVEYEALDLHAMMMTSDPSFVLLEPNSLKIIKELRTYRDEHLIDVTFTIDAGPNIHVLYPVYSEDLVEEFLIKNFLEKGIVKKIIFDQVGMGPIQL